eukprot:snap_masked-scaffold_112-processed-gene-0.5-mRNA-1 protein AED:1.00 eAED:1.00 QI:0/0/0/0/1/1/2/0/101
MGEVIRLEEGRNQPRRIRASVLAASAQANSDVPFGIIVSSTPGSGYISGIAVSNSRETEESVFEDGSETSLGTKGTNTENLRRTDKIGAACFKNIKCVIEK